MSYETEFCVEMKLRTRLMCYAPQTIFRPGKQSQSMALCSVPSARGDDGGRHGGSPVDLAAPVDSGVYVRIPLRLRSSLVVQLLFFCVFVRIGAAIVCVFVSDGGRHGASSVGLKAQGHLVGYVRVPCRL